MVLEIYLAADPGNMAAQVSSPVKVILESGLWSWHSLQSRRGARHRLKVSGKGFTGEADSVELAACMLQLPCPAWTCLAHVAACWLGGRLLQVCTEVHIGTGTGSAACSKQLHAARWAERGLHAWVGGRVVEAVLGVKWVAAAGVKWVAAAAVVRVVRVRAEVRAALHPGTTRSQAVLPGHVLAPIAWEHGLRLSLRVRPEGRSPAVQQCGGVRRAGTVAPAPAQTRPLPAPRVCACSPACGDARADLCLQGGHRSAQACSTGCTCAGLLAHPAGRCQHPPRGLGTVVAQLEPLVRVLGVL